MGHPHWSGQRRPPHHGTLQELLWRRVERCEDRDQCNGAFIDGQYVYVGSHEFPYVVGCWGPGPEVEFAPDCSNNTCGSTDSSTTPGAEEDDDNSDDGSDSSDTGAMSIVANIGAALTAFVALNF